MAEPTQPRSTPPLRRIAAGLLLAVVVAAAIYVASSPAAPRDGARSSDGYDPRQALADAEQYLKAAEPGKAEAVLRELLEHRPEDADAHGLMAELLMGRKRYEEAYGYVVAGLRVAPDNEDAQFFAGVLASQIGRLEEARRHHERAAALAPASARHPVYLGTVLLNMSDPDGAEAQARRAQQLDGSLPEAYILRAKIAEHRSQLDAAIGFTRTAIDLLDAEDEQHLDFVLYQNQLLRAAGQPQEALSLLSGLDPAQQRSARIISEMAESYRAMGEPVKAAAVWAELFALEPQNARAAAEAGLCLVTAGQLREARRYLARASAIDPRHESVKALESAIALAPRPEAAAGDTAPVAR